MGRGGGIAHPAERLLGALLLLYMAASFLHFSHNAENLSRYPNLPAWISRVGIYVIWLGMTTVGCLAYRAHRRRRTHIALIVLALYAAAGLGGLLHYTRAPFSAHTATMNATIVLEASMGAALLAVTAVVACQGGASRRGHAARPED